MSWLTGNPVIDWMAIAGAAFRPFAGKRKAAGK